MTTPEQLARQAIDRLLTAAGWAVQDVKAADIHAALSAALREFPLEPGQGQADYLQYENGKAAYVVEAKKQATNPIKQTLGLSNQNLVVEYGHPQAVADCVNVNYDACRINTEVTKAGSTVEAGYWLQVLDKPSRARRLALATTQLDDDLEYAPEDLDRSVQTPDQIRTIARTLCDRWQADLLPQRQELPEPLYWTASANATRSGVVNNTDRIVEILREELRKGNEHGRRAKRFSKECSSGRI